MYFTTVIKKTVTGIMQVTGSFAEPITRTLGIRVRTAADSVVEILHDDTNGAISVSPGKLLMVADSVEINGLNLPPASTGNTAARPATPTLGQEYFDTDLDDWIKWNGSEWRYLTGVTA